MIRSDNIGEYGSYNNRYYIGNLGVSKVNLNLTLKYIQKIIQNGNHEYICVCNTRTAYLANQNLEYCTIQNHSLLTVPDGTPLVWIAHNNGHKEVGRVSGFELMHALFSDSFKNNYSHYFYGSTPKTIAVLEQNLKKRYPELRIAAAVSPPFQPLEKFDLDILAEEINSTAPTFFWCGLGAPKQEYLISQLQPKMKSTICIGVGLAFEYIAGTVRRAPLWMQKYGLEWAYRLSQQPNNIRRAIKPFSWMIWQIIASKIKTKENK